MDITSISALEILDSRGNPTVRAYLRLEDGSLHSASVPSGASTGSYEAVELRDGDKNRYLGQGVQKAVRNINTTLQKTLLGFSVEHPEKIDTAIFEADGTKDKSNLGANACLAVSLAANRAAAYTHKVPLWQFINMHYMKNITPSFPRLMVNLINGGRHAGWNFDIQEFMIVPTESAPSNAVRVASEIFHHLGALLREKKLSTLVGDEGGYSPFLFSNEEVIETIIEAAQKGKYTNKKEYQIALDAASSEFFSDGKYNLKKSQKEFKSSELLEYYMQLRQKYGVSSFEDPFAEDDWDAFSQITDYAKNEFMVVGDDLFVTNSTRIKKGIEKKAANAALIKLNQIGTVTETIDAIKQARGAGWKIIISHRSGETEDPFIADFAYGVGAEYIKTGSMSRSERLTKYNRLLEIEAKIES